MSVTKTEVQMEKQSGPFVYDNIQCLLWLKHIGNMTTMVADSWSSLRIVTNDGLQENLKNTYSPF